MISLPQTFLDQMQELLGEEYPAFLASYGETRRYGLRENPLKITPEDFAGKAPFHLRPVEGIRGAWSYAQEDGVARHPYYAAGLYYLQEPSAMTPASVLDVHPGERVLDLCAAPGGKSTALGAALQGRGLLVANDISASRCKALLKNCELFGITNAVVTNASPQRLAERFVSYFDSVLVDAPCSGEGMFRKDEAVIRAWYPEKPIECAKQQKQIALQGVRMLRPGGRLLYSTCTFAVEENEEVIRYLLRSCPDLQLLPIPERAGFAPGIGEGMENCVRLWPHRSGGEGHFLALLGKRQSTQSTGCEQERQRHVSAAAKPFPSGSPMGERRGIGSTEELLSAAGLLSAMGQMPTAVMQRRDNKSKKKEKSKDAYALTRSAYVTEEGRERGGRRDRKSGREISQKTLLTTRQCLMAAGDFLEKTGLSVPYGKVIRKGKSLFIVPEDLQIEMLSGIPYLRCGLLLGQMVGERFEPAQALAMVINPSDGKAQVTLPPTDERLARYLRGETITLSEEERAGRSGWVLICVERFPLGWGRLTGNVVKNKYLAGWRMSS